MSIVDWFPGLLNSLQDILGIRSVTAFIRNHSAGLLYMVASDDFVQLGSVRVVAVV